ncbi:MAG: 50S ribosomal protein L17 [Candidatus Carbobacillus altaicus]|uniref:Large ribosomal subunit protein bL17 n=1 Tax=Candidatus Carbonibacillus altaicus TaxID=2163959 RepID=A0A2R6Y2Q4_9BACL|nr:50S ribosomal protein L17 [Candidatus Carbobacillus altaicus]PTQ56966.1 MAG: LSU ribosomal protein L17p [Candidatus Carbobacillus altaicus]
MARSKLGRPSAARKALLRDLVTQLILHEQVETTLPKAKNAARLADEMITLAKRGDLHARRQVAAFVRPLQTDPEDPKSKDAVQKLFDIIAPRYADRNGGYTRVLKKGPRRGDGAEMAILEFVD